MKLIDIAEGRGCLHPISIVRPDSYLDSLSQAVHAQQNDDVHHHGAFNYSAFDSEQGPAGETTFGATHPEGEDPEQRNGKVDYYDVPLHISLAENYVRSPNCSLEVSSRNIRLKGLQ